MSCFISVSSLARKPHALRRASDPHTETAAAVLELAAPAPLSEGGVFFTLVVKQL